MSAGPSTAARDALVDRLFQAAVATFDLFSVYLGDRLGLYRALADCGRRRPGSWRRRPGSTRGMRASGSSSRRRPGSRRRESGGRTRSAALLSPPGHEEVLIEETSLNSPHRSPSRRSRARDRSMRSSMRSGAARGSPSTDTARTRGSRRNDRPVRCSSSCSEASGYRRSPNSMSGSALIRPPASPMSPAAAVGRVSRSHASTRRSPSKESTSTGRRSTRRSETSRGSGVEDRVRFHCRDAADAAARALRPGDDLRSVARHAAARRCAADDPRHAVRRGSCSSATNAPRTRSPHPHPTVNASTTASASCPASPAEWSAPNRQEPEPSCAPTRSALQPKPASRASASCRSRTTLGGSLLAE